MGALLAKILDGFAKGLLGKMFAGAGITFASTAIMTGIVEQYIARLQSMTGSISADMLAILHLGGFDYAISVILSAVMSRLVLDGTHLTLKRTS